MSLLYSTYELVERNLCLHKHLVPESLVLVWPFRFSPFRSSLVLRVSNRIRRTCNAIRFIPTTTTQETLCVRVHTYLRVCVCERARGTRAWWLSTRPNFLPRKEIPTWRTSLCLLHPPRPANSSHSSLLAAASGSSSSSWSKPLAQLNCMFSLHLSFTLFLYIALHILPLYLPFHVPKQGS